MRKFTNAIGMYPNMRSYYDAKSLFYQAEASRLDKLLEEYQEQGVGNQSMFNILSSRIAIILWFSVLTFMLVTGNIIGVFQ